MQTVLSNLRVRGNRLELTLRDLGSFRVDDYLHTFPLKRVHSEEYDQVKLDLQSRISLNSFSWKEQHSFLDLIQVDAPPQIALSHCYTLEQIRRHLLNHPENVEYFTWIERMFDYLKDNPPPDKTPYTLEKVRSHLLAHPKVQPRHHSIINHIISAAEDCWPALAELNPDQNKKDKSPKIKVPSPLPESFHRGNYTALARWRIAPQGSIVEIEDSLAEEIRSGKKELSLEGRLRYERARTTPEILGEKVVFLDTEVPLYDTAEEELSWAGMIFHQSGTASRGSLYTLYPVISQPSFSAQQVSTEGELAAKISNEIKNSQTTLFVAYNVPFDALHLREIGNFTLGEDEEEPKVLSSLKFFERIGIKGLDILDLYRWARTQFRYLPNQKLVTVARKVLGENAFSKQINYQQQAELERICRRDSRYIPSPEVAVMLADRPAPEIIAAYLREDIKVLEKIWESDFFTHGAEDLSFLSQLFKIDFFLLAHNPNRIQDYLERKFFEKVGTFYSAAFPPFKAITEYEQRVKDKLERIVQKNFPAKAEGRIEQIIQVFLPLGKAFREDLAPLLPEAEEFHRYLDSHRADPQRHFFLAQYEDALTSWIWTDYAAQQYEQDKFHKMAGKREPKLEVMFGGTYNVLKARDLGEKVHRGSLTQKDFRTVFTGFDQAYLQQEGMDFREYFFLFKQWARAREKNRLLFGAYQCCWENLESRLNQFSTKVNQFLQSSDLEIIHTQGKFLYLRGDPEKLKAADCPVIPTDQISAAYLADGKIFYPRYGYIRSFKRDDQPTNQLNLWEMQTYGSFLEEIFAGNQDQALTYLWSGLKELTQKKVPSENLVWRTAYNQRYRAYVKGKEIQFYNWRLEETYRVKVIKEEEYRIDRQKEGKRDFILEPCLEQGEIVYHKRYLQLPSAIKPDWERYAEKALERTIALTKPLLGKETAKFAQDALSLNPKRSLDYYLDLTHPKVQQELIF
ncbi:MAG TPA: hypothetical protein VJA23_06650 [Candidatus Nanoarchaeia archaeon]|nr:hypothetical protein [Candidatus Nanoarchaeia archaeon]